MLVIQFTSAPGHSKGAMWDRLDAALERYSKALLRYRALSQLSPTNPLHHKHLQFWLTDTNGGLNDLQGVTGTLWDACNIPDLTSLTQPSDPSDPLTNLFNNHLLPLYHQLIGHKIHAPSHYITTHDAFTDAPHRSSIIYHYSDRLVLRTLNVASTVLASMVPALSSLALYYMPSEGAARIGGVVAFTFLFSLVIVLVTPAKRIETFVATAAFAAVLIVFVGGQAD
ncbi:hypothetical protein LTR84_013071 [Exophiala bonariae]|uniref:DUF6594 domain-containing protein n=1 Tax=Exophiala bonariae TaxID=1690606 RepID=A0AAV9NHA2_9EURO|nr:hypothetical protein LTR84_013071 [Exophiala bonariae]